MTATESLPAGLMHVLAAQLRNRSPDARALFRLLKLRRHLPAQAAGPDGELAEGLVRALARAIEAAAGTLRLDPGLPK
jgi:hypothetical protein